VQILSLSTPRGRPETRRTIGRRLRGGGLAFAIGLSLLCATTGCGALLLLGGAGTSAVAFATGELRSTEDIGLARLDVASGLALDTLGYETLSVTREPGFVHWKARTPSGDPVDLRLRARDPQRTELRIRVGVFGDETRSRLVLEQIRQSL